MKNPSGTTDFGYQQVSWAEKAEKVDAVFTTVADQYDVMNDLMSLGIHRLWKRFATGISGFKTGDWILDLAGGTGDLTRLLAPKIGSTGHIVLADINSEMLSHGRDRCIDAGLIATVDYAQVNAECLPFSDASFDGVIIGFGLRNVTDKFAALQSMQRVLKPGGKLMVLEFSKTHTPGLKQLYDLYSFSVLPVLGKFIAGSAESYRYLAESIRMHPDQESLKQLILDAGFDDCEYHNLTGGIVALHIAHKY